jgi:hypothetical protein
VILKPTTSLQCIDYYYAFHSHVWCDVNFSYTMFVCVATSRRASERGPDTQQVETAGQELIEGKLCP